MIAVGKYNREQDNYSWYFVVNSESEAYDAIKRIQNEKNLPVLFQTEYEEIEVLQEKDKRITSYVYNDFYDNETIISSPYSNLQAFDQFKGLNITGNDVVNFFAVSSDIQNLKEIIHHGHEDLIKILSSDDNKNLLSKLCDKIKDNFFSYSYYFNNKIVVELFFKELQEFFDYSKREIFYFAILKTGLITENTPSSCILPTILHDIFEHNNIQLIENFYQSNASLFETYQFNPSEFLFSCKSFEAVKFLCENYLLKHNSEEIIEDFYKYKANNLNQEELKKITEYLQERCLLENIDIQLKNNHLSINF